MTKIGDLIDALEAAGYGRPMVQDTVNDAAPELRVVLPDGTTATRCTRQPYRHVVVVKTDDGWRPFRWILHDRDLLRAVAEARYYTGSIETQTLEVESEN